MIAKREDKATGKVSFERRYYLSSITEVEVFAEANPRTLGCGKQPALWVLDMVFRADESRVRSGDTPAIFNMLRQMANKMLRAVDSKLSIKARRFQAALDDDFRTKAIVLGC